jgi:hypothetical protein
MFTRKPAVLPALTDGGVSTTVIDQFGAFQEADGNPMAVVGIARETARPMAATAGIRRCRKGTGVIESLPPLGAEPADIA